MLVKLTLTIAWDHCGALPQHVEIRHRLIAWLDGLLHSRLRSSERSLVMADEPRGQDA